MADDSHESTKGVIIPDQYVQDMYDTINRLNMWSLFDEAPPKETGYAQWNNPDMHKIIDNLKYRSQHSGASIAITFRNVQYIAKKGLERYLEDFHEDDYDHPD